MHRTIRTACWVLALTLCMTAITGCWDAVEVNDLSIVIAAGIDTAPGNQILYSAQVVVPNAQSSQSGAGTGTGETPFVVSAVGRDVRDAHKNLQLKLSRRYFVSHRGLYLIGEDLARQGLRQFIDEPTRNPQSRLRTNVVITKGRAINYLQITYPFEQMPAEGLHKLLIKRRVVENNIDLSKLSYMLATPGIQPMLPIVKMAPMAPGEPLKFAEDGMALFHGDRMIGELSTQETEGVQWLREKIQHTFATFSVPGHKGYLSTVLLRVSSDYQIRLVNGMPQIHLLVKPVDDLMENQSDLNFTDPDQLRVAEAAFSAHIKKLLDHTVDVLQHEYQTDPVGFGIRVYHAYPREWPKERLKAEWNDVFPKIPITIEVQGQIERIGMTGQSLARNK